MERNSLSDAFTLTRHALERLRQRGLPEEVIHAAWEYGIPEYHRGAVRYWLTRRELRGTPYANAADRFHRVCVVIYDDHCVATVKRCRKWRRRS